MSKTDTVWICPICNTTITKLVGEKIEIKMIEHLAMHIAQTNAAIMDRGRTYGRDGRS